MSFKMPRCNCLDCGYPMDAASNPFTGHKPSPGDVSICLECGHIMVFKKNLTIRNPRGKEFHAIAGDERIIAIQKARVAIQDSDIKNTPKK